MYTLVLQLVVQEYQKKRLTFIHDSPPFPFGEFINNPSSRLQVDSGSTTSRVDSKTWGFAVFMNKCLGSTITRLKDFVMKTSALVFSCSSSIKKREMDGQYGMTGGGGQILPLNSIRVDLLLGWTYRGCVVTHTDLRVEHDRAN
jgi:hypothetical protein